VRTYNTKGVVLRRSDHRDNDRLFVIYTESYGKLEVVARGTKKILSKLNPHLEPLTQVNLMVAKGKGYDKLANAIAINQFINLKNVSDPIIMAATSYMAEVTEKFIQTKYPEPLIYSKLVESLNAMDRLALGEVKREEVLMIAHGYVLKLLDILGYRPDLGRCVECTKGMLFPKRQVFDFHKGGLVCDSCKNITMLSDFYLVSDSLIKILNLILAETSTTIENYRFTPLDQKEFNEIIPKLLSYQLERSVKSLEFINSF